MNEGTPSELEGSETVEDEEHEESPDDNRRDDGKAARDNTESPGRIGNRKDDDDGTESLNCSRESTADEHPSADEWN